MGLVWEKETALQLGTESNRCADDGAPKDTARMQTSAQMKPGLPRKAARQRTERQISSCLFNIPCWNDTRCRWREKTLLRRDREREREKGDSEGREKGRVEKRWTNAALPTRRPKCGYECSLRKVSC